MAAELTKLEKLKELSLTAFAKELKPFVKELEKLKEFP